MMRGLLALGLGLLLSAVSCVGTSPWLEPLPVATNGPKQCTAGANWGAEEGRISHSYEYQTQRMGEGIACDIARQRLAARSAEVCQTSFGSRTDIRNLTAITQFGYPQCDCIDFLQWTRCTITGDAVCRFEAAVPGSYDCG